MDYETPEEEERPLQDAYGQTFVHSHAFVSTLEQARRLLLGDISGLPREDCRTPCPEPVCRCGYYRLRWPTWEELRRESLAGPVA